MPSPRPSLGLRNSPHNAAAIAVMRMRGRWAESAASTSSSNLRTSSGPSASWAPA
eukprot:CAMPEP_0177529050 /NCGR_PEP_ID=MMETSP0369-20130122/52575_1 /TAXON_ID=447022 ORGANISM="Scrippsiella hangoei-like, Strain SHHI-4" /NCGR_SAMPLE_ID=MMETSP0369 /ASSEMBLY_ACC=CAM_ASM_000364 /LENGTH=54 /DNA_ID=CAMNT_0019009645 /DNA_START=55 /DNA_END=216 /DNA_ORIENTATION=+